MIMKELTDKEWMEEFIVITRLSLYNRGLQCGPHAIKEQMEQEAPFLKIPSVSTIARVLKRNYLTHKRTGYYREDYYNMYGELVKDPNNF